MPMRALPKKRLNAIAMLQQGRSTQEVSKLLGISQSTCSRIHTKYVPHVESPRGGCPRRMCKSHV
jgi:DNA-directed RNA polymerase specialized sigma subunit